MNAPVNIRDAATALAQGKLVAFPTETVYGLGADATNDQAVARVFEAKGRPSFNPLISHVARPIQVWELGKVSSLAEKLANAFWPGPLTLVLPRTLNCKVSLLASAGLPTIAIRIPRHPLALSLLEEFGGPVVAPSANPSGRISPTTAEHVHLALGHKVHMVLDGGPCEVGLESTVVSCLDDEPVILRLGGLDRAAISELLGFPIRLEHPGKELHAPGQLESHYAPRARLRLNVTMPDKGEAYLGFGDQDVKYNLSRSASLVEAAANLFRMLHELDASAVETIAVAPIPATGLGEAINDRLRRAAAPRAPA